MESEVIQILTTELLGFDQLKINSLAAQMSRGKLEKSTSIAFSSIGNSLAKLSMDICLYMGQDFNFISFPKNLTTGSSIMPQKKNPDAAELIRAKIGRIFGANVALMMVMKGLPFCLTAKIFKKIKS